MSHTLFSILGTSAAANCILSEDTVLPTCERRKFRIFCALDRKVLYNIYISKYTIDRWNVFIWHYYDSCWLNIVARIWDGLIYDPMVSHKKTSFKLKFRRFPEFFRMVGNTEWDTVLQRKLQSNNITLCRYLYRWLCGCWWLCPSYTV